MLNIIVNAAFASALVAAAPSTYRDEDANPYMPKKLRGISASAGLGGDGAKLRVRVSLEAPAKIEEGGAPEGNILRNINPTSDTSEKTLLGFDSSKELGHLDNYVVQENALGHANQALRNATPASDIIEKIPSGFDPSEELGYLENATYGTALDHALAVGTGFDSTEDIPLYFLDDYEAYAHWYEASVSGNLNFYTGKVIDNLTDGAHEVGDLTDSLPSDEIFFARDLGKEGPNPSGCGGNYPVINRSGNDFENLVYDCYYGYSYCTSPYNVPLGCWDTSQVTDMAYAFTFNRYFNEDISFWNTESVTTMRGIFAFANAFNQDISYWDVSNVTDLFAAFQSTSVFDQPLKRWDVGNVEDMIALFAYSAFDQPLDGWDVGKVRYAPYVFYNTGFNQCLSSWPNKVRDDIDVLGMFVYSSCSGPDTPQPDVSPWCQTVEDGCDRGCGGNYPVIYKSGDDFRNLVYDCTYGNSDCFSQYNVPLGCWETSQVTDMSYAFFFNYGFNEDISFWNTAKVTDFNRMFFYTENFNQDISYWDLSAATDMYLMFAFAFKFNQPLGVWDVSNMAAMYGVFGFAYTFNQPLDNWDVGKVTDMNFMFYNSPFNQCLSSWANKVPDYVQTISMFFGSSCLGPETPQPNISPWCQTVEDGCGYATESPTKNPTESPTRNPTESPTKNPTESPTRNPTESPTKNPTESPTRNPTESPTKNPTESPTASPTENSLCKNNPDQFTFTAELTCEDVASAGRKLRNDLCNNLQGNIKASCPNACQLKPSEDNTDDFTFTSDTTCDEILSTNVSKKTITILCDDPFGLALNCPQFCPATDNCPCVDSILPFKIPGGGIISCAEVDSSEDKDKLCKKRKIKGKCQSVCATPGCD